MDLEQSRARRRARERERMRRRGRGLAALVAVAAAVPLGVVVAGSFGGGGGPHPRSAAGLPTGPTQTRPAAGVPTRTAPAQPAPRATGPPSNTAIPILVYHVIAAPPAGAPFPGLYVSEPEFVDQLRALKRAGWHAVTLDQALAHWRHSTPLGPGRPIVLSFDNGYRTHYTRARPDLRTLRWVGVENLQLTGLPPAQGGLTQAQVKGLLKAGWELDTQGRSHADLIALSPVALRAEVAGARQTIRRRFGVQADWFCYPSGHYNPTVVSAVHRAGFVGATTVVPGWARHSDDAYRLPRIRVLGGTSGPALLRLLEQTRRDPPAPAAYGA
jgi:peptidoglycan/xylan/chitin deacetylase (PgdA/CDA1 family)